MLADLRGLEALLWISRKGSFSAAAKQLNTTQPAISMRIREFERRLGVSLIDRSRGKARLTPKGMECVSYADRMVSLSSHLMHSMANPQAFEGRVRVGVSESVALSWLPRLVTRVNREYPQAVLEIDVDITARLWSRLAAGDYDIILLPEPIAQAEVMTESLGTLKFDWMASPQLKIPKGPLGPRQLENVPIVTVSRESNLAAVIETWFQRGHAMPRVVNYCNSIATVASLTIAGVGISILPPSLFAGAVKAGELLRLNTDPPVQPIQFWAVCSLSNVQPLPRQIARLAQETSGFVRS
jgi:DNA-binding transcriptional LysR family regulator